MSSDPAYRNLLLRSLDASLQRRLRKVLVPIDLPQGEILAVPDTAPGIVYFLDQGIASIVAGSAEGDRAEAGICGKEGFAPVGQVLGADTNQYEVVVQVAGSGWKIESEDFSAALQQEAEFSRACLRYIETFTTQMVSTVAANATCSVEERLARWVLMCQDRLEGDEIALTHGFLALMLSVRRPTVTMALHELEGRHWIRSTRGLVAVRDREALIEFAGEHYGRSEAEYRILFKTTI